MSFFYKFTLLFCSVYIYLLFSGGLWLRSSVISLLVISCSHTIIVRVNNFIQVQMNSKIIGQEGKICFQEPGKHNGKRTDG